MIDLHTHTLLSDGDLLPSELVRRAAVKGYEAIALTDHCDFSNIDFVLPRIVKVSRNLNSHWPIKVIPGMEITHVPLKEIKNLINYGRHNGAKIIVVHGETLSEPVIPGTNREAIRCKADIIAHPGLLTEEDANLAKENSIYIEITTREAHLQTNRHIRDIARKTGVKLLLNTDTHAPEDLMDDAKAQAFLESLEFTKDEIDKIFRNSRVIAGFC
ncbi:MAG: histidinol phosphate phosphatase domain-containing protein [Candidatus Omnitrophica bacterium]|nr:histidinol phosphate phosphatase domain-containing protein [Candidatus Omnitrophota bacterium]